VRNNLKLDGSSRGRRGPLLGVVRPRRSDSKIKWSCFPKRVTRPCGQVSLGSQSPPPTSQAPSTTAPGRTIVFVLQTLSTDPTRTFSIYLLMADVCDYGQDMRPLPRVLSAAR